MHRTKAFISTVAGILTVIFVVLGVLIFQHFTRVGFRSTGEHPLANKLHEEIEILPYLKDGNMYYYCNGNSSLIAEDVYDSLADDPVFTADYAIDKDSGKMLYTKNGVLYLFDGNNTIKIAENVTSWRTAQGLNVISFTTPWHNSKDKGVLFLYLNGTVSAVDTGVTNATVKFSQSGNCLFYEKENQYPKIRTQLYRFDLSGTKDLVHGSSYPLMWVNDDGTQIVTGENIDDGLYSYRVFSKNLKKQKSFDNVYFSEVTDDKSILYMLYDYDYDLRKGTLAAVDLYTLKTKEIAKNVSFFNVSAVTDASKGVLYSVLTDEENQYYSIYYGSIAGKSTRLIHNTTEDSLYNVAINSNKMEGYVLSLGATKINGGIYSIKWDKNGLITNRIDSGNVDSLIYYEESHSITYIKNASEGVAELYFTDFSGNIRLLTDLCGVTYSSTSQTHSSSSVLSKNTRDFMFFRNIKTGKTTVDTSGTLFVNENKIDENVSSGYMEAPITDASFSAIYYLKKSEDKMDLFMFNGTDTTLIDTDVQGIVQLN